MKGICLLLVVLACASANTVVDKEWEEFKTKYDKVYSQEEEAHRHKVFRDNLKYIEEHNKLFKGGKSTFSLGVNKYADLLVSEAQFLRGTKIRAKDARIKGSTRHVPKSVGADPDSIDWRDQGYVTGVKDQGQCGSCWAFSATGSLEGQHFAATGDLVSLSEQNLVDCSLGSCNGGWQYWAFQYIIDNGGIDTEESYPYTAMDGVCSFNPDTIGATCTGWVDIEEYSEDALLDAVATVGPISVTIDASHASFQLYSGGVYYEAACDPDYLDHAVLAVGYGVDNGVDYWLVKNSWGTSWGDGGYIEMSRNADNNCGIASACFYPTV